MTKNEFLSRLEAELEARRVPEPEDILGEYRRHFEYKLADGYSEEEIAARLGAPEELAAQFEPEREAPRPSRAGSAARSALTWTGLVFADMFVLSFFMLFASWVAVVACAALASGLVSLCLLIPFDMQPYVNLPEMPYWCGAVYALALAALTVLVWTAHELCLLPAARRERALRRLSALLLGVNILKYAPPPLLGGKLVLPVEFSAAAYFTTPGIILMTRGKLRCWAAYAGLLAGGVYYGAMCLAGGYIYGANPPAQVLLSLFCHGSLLVLVLTVTGTERFGPRDAALLPLGVAGVAARAALLRPWAGGGTLLIYELLDARALHSSGLTAALPVYYAALAAFVLISPRLYLAANRASLRRGEEHLRAAPV